MIPFSDDDFSLSLMCTGRVNAICLKLLENARQRTECYRDSEIPT